MLTGMKQTHRTARKENPGDGGRGPSRQRAHAFMGNKTKEQWARRALDLEDALRLTTDRLREVDGRCRLGGALAAMVTEAIEIGEKALGDSNG